MSNFGQKKKFAPFFWGAISSILNQGQTHLEATGGPRGASQPLQSIKIDKKPNLKTNTPNKDNPRGAMISGPVIKCVILATFKSQLVSRPLGTLTITPKHQI